MKYTLNLNIKDGRTTYASSNLDILLLFSLSPNSGEEGVCLRFVTHFPASSPPFLLNSLSFLTSTSPFSVSGLFASSLVNILRSTGDRSCLVLPSSVCVCACVVVFVCERFVFVSGLCSIVNWGKRDKIRFLLPFECVSAI